MPHLLHGSWPDDLTGERSCGRPLGPVPCTLGYLGWRTDLDARSSLLSLCAGMFAFSFIEYAIHRWLFHSPTCFMSALHDAHHEAPVESTALPCVTSAVVALVSWGRHVSHHRRGRHSVLSGRRDDRIFLVRGAAPFGAPRQHQPTSVALDAAAVGHAFGPSSAAQHEFRGDDGGVGSAPRHALSIEVATAILKPHGGKRVTHASRTPRCGRPESSGNDGRSAGFGTRVMTTRASCAGAAAPWRNYGVRRGSVREGRAASVLPRTITGRESAGGVSVVDDSSAR
jgi:hypothetical protein